MNVLTPEKPNKIIDSPISPAETVGKKLQPFKWESYLKEDHTHKIYLSLLTK